jgi:PKHD-type hydroxylase
MLVCVSGALPIAAIAALRSAMEKARDTERVSFELAQTLCKDGAFQRATYPADIGAPSLHVHEPGRHDEGAAPSTPGMRSDIAVIVNLNDEADYEGGDVVIEMSGFERRWRGSAGSWIAHPAGARTRVEAVTAGRRCLLTFELQSFVRDAAKRRVLGDLSSVLASLEQRKLAGPPGALLRRCYEDLLRHWAESGPATIA